MITYNHANYVGTAIEGVLKQCTEFSYNLVIGEDCSIDETRKICESYSLRNSTTIKLLPSSERLGMIDNLYRTLNACSGKYIAICEGDDYWTDPQKLQKQTDFMVANPDCSICFHSAEHVHEGASLENFIQRPKRIHADGIFSIKRAILCGGGFMPSASMFFRAELFQNIPAWCLRSPVGDLPMMLVLAARGRIGYIDEVMSAYRVMSASSWSQQMLHKERRKQHHNAVSKMWREFDAWTGYKHSFWVHLKLLKNWLHFRSSVW
jgi:glycosyltransferase involved in cell wall biosynthesis